MGPSYHAHRCPGATWTKGHFCQSSFLGPHSRLRVPTANLTSRVRYLPGEEAGSADHVVGTECPEGWRMVEGGAGEDQRTRAGIPSLTQA